MRATRDLLRRRNHFAHNRTDLPAHIQNTNSQYNLPEFGKKLSRKINRAATHHDPQALHLLKTVYGIGKTLSLVILYEIHDINRFPRVQDLASYSRLVKCPRESAGKRHGSSGKKIGSMHLKWAFSEAAVLFLRENPKGMAYKKRLERKHGKSKALTIIAHRLGRAVYYMLKRERAFDVEKFLRE